MPEPRDPLLKVVTIICIRTGNARCKKGFVLVPAAGCPAEGERKVLVKRGYRQAAREGVTPTTREQAPGGRDRTWFEMDNDPSAGSPTERFAKSRPSKNQPTQSP